ncbi:unnamed protein product [Adineta steineri]|uniref:Uncharacterized protein n=1 Tax=Adineta steineri TaxID=433720 RepID=A0A818ZD61_9BILA|nr:unnamed protein product [Adineta steineri]CAF3767245.1 unnamed protein product [Adineta steineri]
MHNKHIKQQKRKRLSSNSKTTRKRNNTSRKPQYSKLKVLSKIKSTQARKKTRRNSTSRPQSKRKQYILEKRDRTTSLMALQALAAKIAMYKKKYGNIETRNSSIIVPSKQRNKRFV